MCTKVDNVEIIILSDDEDEPSVLIVESKDVTKSDCAVTPSIVDEDLVVTYSRRAEVLPHARYDCPIHPFTAADTNVNTPLDSNQLCCDQCFCYICDKPASSCAMWCQGAVCHCNSHKKSNLWNSIRDRSLLGGLRVFNLTLSEVDAHLRRADMLLQSFREELSAQFSIYLLGVMVEENVTQLNQRRRVIDYTPVFELVSSFLDKADKEDARAAAIMRLGAAETFNPHRQGSGISLSKAPTANVAEAKVLLMQRVVSSLQRQLVMADFTPEFSRKLQDFYKNRLCFSGELKTLKNSLCVRSWDDVLLVSVLKGQNVSGIRKDKGKRDVLVEPISVIVLRAEKLQEQHRYRELCRYLRVVHTEDSKFSLQLVQDLIPYFLCVEGNFMAALDSLFPSRNAPALRLTPSLFIFYLHIFKTATAPRLVVSEPSQLYSSDAAWEPIKGAEPLRRDQLVKFALTAQKCCYAVFTDSHCWTCLLAIVNTPQDSLPSLPAPDPKFLNEAKEIVNSILVNNAWFNVQIPRGFLTVYPDQALLLLVTGALSLRIIVSPLTPALPVLNTYKANSWALEWLWKSFSTNVDALNLFIQEVTHEIENTADGFQLLPYLRGIAPSLRPPSEDSDHTYCNPVAIRLRPSLVETPSQPTNGFSSFAQKQLNSEPDSTLTLDGGEDCEELHERRQSLYTDVKINLYR